VRFEVCIDAGALAGNSQLRGTGAYRWQRIRCQWSLILAGRKIQISTPLSLRRK
jgi:hypothetical protein